MKIKGKVVIRKGRAEIGKKSVPRGSVAFYWRLSSGKGLKVFYGLENGMKTTTKKAESIFNHMRKLHDLGVAVKAYSMEKVSLDLRVGGKRVRRTVPAIKVRHLSQNGPGRKYKPFIHKLKKVVKKTGISNTKDSFKRVNILWDKRVKSWQLVDVR